MISNLIFIFFLLIFMYFLNFHSFLNSLVILESLGLILLFHLMFLMFIFYSLKMVLFYFVFVVSESALGLSVLVKSVKFFGTNNFRSMNLTLF